MNRPLNFGVFITPFHPVGQSPTVALEYDIERIVALDRLGFDEVWFGEHHSGGYELIACPEVFIAAAAERTKHIRLGTGVVSLPYHHPLMVADRWVLLDHLTRGRVMFGTGPGALPSDAYMMGIDPIEQRRMMQESLEAILALFRAAPERADQPALRLVHPARRAAAHPAVHLAVSRNLHGSNDFPVRSAAGRRAGHVAAVAVDVGARRLRRAGEHLGGGRRPGRESPAATSPTAPTGGCWRSCTSPTPATRRSTTAPTGCRTSRTTSAPPGFVPLANSVEGTQSPREFVEEYAAKGNCCIGTPDDAIAYIEDLLERSGGFGTLLMLGHDWASPAGHLPLLRTVRPQGHSALQGSAEARRGRRTTGPRACATS